MKRMITVAGVCSGIGGFDVGFLRANTGLADVEFRVLWTCEVDPFARAVLQHRFPEARHYTDMMDDELLAAERPDILMGGTPCQGFSVAGLRGGLNDNRSNLCLRYVVLANALAPSLVLWENVPGVLSMPDNAFGQFLAGLVGAAETVLPEPSPCEPGRRDGATSGRWRWNGGDWHARWDDAGMVAGPQRTCAWRVLDAQYLGVAQRRERVFLVASAGDMGVASHTGAVRRVRDGVSPLPATLLFEPDGVRRDTPPSRAKGEAVAPTLSARTQGGGGLGTDTELDGGLVATDGEGKPGLPVSEVREAQRADVLADGGVLSMVRAPAGHGGAGIPEVSYALSCGAGGSKFGTGRHNQDAESGLLVPVIPSAGPGPHVLAFPEYLSGTACASTENLAPALGAQNPTAVCFDETQITSPANYSQPQDGDPCHPLSASARAPALAFKPRHYRHDRKDGAASDLPGALTSSAQYVGDCSPHVAYQEHHWHVRRLTPRECERLQGFNDDHTLVPLPNGKLMSDSQRYKQCGNAVCANVAEWLARRIAKFWPFPSSV